MDAVQGGRFSTRLITGYDIRSLVLSIGHFLLVPSPLNMSSAAISMLPGTLYWYYLMPYFVLGAFVFIKDSALRIPYLLFWAFPIGIIIIMTLMPQINIPRHRIMLMPFVTILIAYVYNKRYSYKYVLLFLVWMIVIAGVVVREILV